MPGRVRFVNTGGEPVVITGARPGCGCTGVEYPHDPIEPGDTAVISFTYNPAGRPGAFEKSIRVYIGDNTTERVMIRGTVLGTNHWRRSILMKQVRCVFPTQSCLQWK